MTKLSIALATVTLTLSLAPAAQAYSVEPTYTITSAALTGPSDVPTSGVCVPQITPELTAALALPKLADRPEGAKLACVHDE